MLKGRGQDSRSASGALGLIKRPVSARVPVVKPEPDYEVVDFPSEQYVNAKLQPPPPPPPRPPTGHPVDIGASCGLCGGGGAHVRCSECGRRALCASCDDMYHRHPKRRHHQRQALSQSQLREERPPLPPKGTPPVPPPRRHKISGDRLSASPRLQAPDQRRANFNMPIAGLHAPVTPITNNNHFAKHRPQISQVPPCVSNVPHHLGSVPYLPAVASNANTPVPSHDHRSMGHFSTWSQPRASLPGYNIPQTMQMQVPPMENWEAQENLTTQSWGRPLRRGASVMELGGNPVNCGGCGHCMSNPNTWRYGSCANLDHSWGGPGPWTQPCCTQHPATANPRMLPHPHSHISQTPQPYRRAESRGVSRAVSRAGSRAASPALSVRSRTSRRTKHRTPSPPIPSSDADSESEADSDRPDVQDHDKEDSLGPAPPPPSATWQCEHCTFVNEPGVRVCAVCCRTPTVTPKIISANVVNNSMAKLKVSAASASITNRNGEIRPRTRHDEKDENFQYSASKHTSKGYSPSPSPSYPRDNIEIKKNTVRLSTPAKDENNSRTVKTRIRHDMAVGTSPPKETKLKENSHKNVPQESQTSVSIPEPPIQKHDISIGLSPPRDNSSNKKSSNASVGISPPREILENRPLSRSSRTNVSNTGTSPPPQSISTQTYEVPTNWDQVPSLTKTRQRRRFRDETQRERSHSRLSLSSDTRESERSAHTSGGRWEWKEPRDSSPSGEWSESDRRRTRLTRRASHLDVRRGQPSRRTSLYGSEAPSPEPLSHNRAISLETIAGAVSRRETERGLELAQLMTQAEKLGFSAAEVHAALAQNPAAPLAWLKERWPSLCAGVRAAAARLAPGSNVSELEARASLARHRGAMWPAVTECVERCRRQADFIGVSEERRLRGHVWGSPAGADDDATPLPDISSRTHRSRAEDSSDEYAESTNKFQDEDWMYLPLNLNHNILFDNKYSPMINPELTTNSNSYTVDRSKAVLKQARESVINEHSLSIKDSIQTDIMKNDIKDTDLADLGQSENDFIDAYNALARLSPILHLNEPGNNIQNSSEELQIHHNNKNAEKIKFRRDEVKPSTSKDIPTLFSNLLDIYGNVEHNEISKPEVSQSDDQNLEQTARRLMDNKKAPSSVNPTIMNATIYNKNIETNIDNLHLEKSSNLSEIVDNTQKLIQQMKKEINIDINSINSQAESQNEAEYSSEDSRLTSEQASSYSGTENDSQRNTTSDENEITSSDEDNFKVQAKVINRTSSEDNDQFEEAMDHIDTQIDDLKKSNIEMLDSIARSLKEEHTLTVEINNLKSSNQTRQDMNNNLFDTVHSFDEIYEQLSKDKEINNEIHTNNEMIDKNNFSKHNKENKSQQKLNSYIKLPINTFSLKVEIPKAVVICDNIHPILTASINNTNESLNVTNDGKEIINQAKSESDYIINDLHHVENSHVTNIPDLNHKNVFTIATTIDDYVQENSNQDLSNADVLSNIESLNENQSFSENKIQELNTSVLNESSHDSDIDKIANTVKENRKPKSLGINKSNIPKLVRTLSNSKQKTERNISKVITSKVPIRKTSIKLYHAPNPPKTGRFGNVQNGNIKQLQSRLFNVKPNQIVTSSSQNEAEVVASTSTLHKKKQAPPPPTQQNVQLTLEEESTTKEKKHQFFRETCRTEDEWSESESDYENETKQTILKPSPVTDPTLLLPSPPPPLTIRQISGQIVDLANIRISEGSPERQARMLLAEGAIETWEQAQVAIELISQGNDPPHALLAALECSDLTSALVYLQQDCELCASKYPEHEMVSMLLCTHRCCRECARLYFTVQITERSIADCVCPYCKEPELENLTEDAWLDYFAHMDILLKTLLETDIHELFQRKLRDRTLALDPNFRWCVECSSGFFVHPKQKKLRCPECKSISCATCRKPWTTNHKGITCDQYALWLEDNDPERSIAAVQQHLRENGLECPRCHFKYSLSRGGCMHFTCTQCKYEFCYGCGKPFMMGARCGLSEYCAKLGLHAHHPRNCLFYLRDKEPHELQTLLQMNNVTYVTESTEGSSGRCPIQLQRETPTGLIDTICGSEALPNQAGLCKMHYVEYLSGLARTLDPIPIMEVSELVAELRRRALPLPERGPWDTDPIYAGMCAEIVKEKIPLN